MIMPLLCDILEARRYANNSWPDRKSREWKAAFYTELGRLVTARGQA
jgi:hypothetical protein